MSKILFLVIAVAVVAYFVLPRLPGAAKDWIVSKVPFAVPVYHFVRSCVAILLGTLGWLWAKLRGGSAFLPAILIAGVLVAALLFFNGHALKTAATVQPTPIATTVKTKPAVVKPAKAAVCPAPKANVSSSLLGAVAAYQNANGAKIKAFQRAHGLPATGVITASTFNAFVGAR